MLKKNLQIKRQSEPSHGQAEAAPKYQRPKILLIDLEDETKTTLEKEGYNVAAGTFGVPYKVQKTSNYQQVVAKAFLPNYTEQEIMIVDLMPSDPEDNPPSETSTPADELDWWAKCSTGVINPRPRVMAIVRDGCDRILRNGGAFIVFADSFDSQQLVYARDEGGYRGLVAERTDLFDNWGFLTILSNLTITNDIGQEIISVRNNTPLVQLLSERLDQAIFCCSFEAHWHIEEQWVVLATNKYGAAVAGYIMPPEKSKGGWVFVLPQIRDKAGFLASFLKNILPDLCPSLFPHAEGQRWVHRPDYELPSVIQKAREISAIQDDAANKITVLESAIEAERSANRYLYDLLRETGEALVSAVQKALTVLGFRGIVDVDAELKKAGRDAALREDLRIHDISPTLVVDIKGVAGKPADAEALQAQKHAYIYIQETNRPDVHGLTIINHQRLLPPLDRDNDMPFRQEILDNAVQMQLGLMTTWDLFRLARGFSRHSWPPDQVRPLFYKTGHILPIPCHYEYVGRVKQVWKNAFSVQIENGRLDVSDRISIEFPVDFEEQSVASLHLNDANVQSATVGVEVGISRNESLPKVKPGFSLYRIKST